MGVWEPGVERKNGELDGKREEEGEEEAGLQRLRDRGDLQTGEVERPRIDGRCEVQSKNADQHERAPQERIDDELHRRVLSAPRPPDRNQHVHRDELHFPEEEKEDQVERAKDTAYSDFEDKKPDEVFLY